MATKKGTVEAAENKKTVKAGSPVVDKKETAEKKETGAPKKKTTAKKTAAVKTALYVQYAGKEYTEKDLVSEVKKAYTELGNKASDIKTVEIYLKPEENVAYYVINGEGSDDFKIEL